MKTTQSICLSSSCHLSALVIPSPGHRRVNNLPSAQKGLGIDGAPWQAAPGTAVLWPQGKDSLQSHWLRADSPRGSCLRDVIYFQHFMFYFPFPTAINSPPLAQRILIGGKGLLRSHWIRFPALVLLGSLSPWQGAGFRAAAAQALEGRLF